VFDVNEEVTVTSEDIVLLAVDELVFADI